MKKKKIKTQKSLSKWRKHIRAVQKQHPGMPLKEVLKIASDTY